MTPDSVDMTAGDSLVEEVADWPMERALAGCGIEALLEGCCVRFLAAGAVLANGGEVLRFIGVPERLELAPNCWDGPSVQ